MSYDPYLDPEVRKLLGPEGPAGYEGEVVEFEARGAVAKLFACRDDEVILSGPAGTGKSRGCLEKIHYLLMKYPNVKALALRKTLVSLASSGLGTYRNHVLHRMDGVTFFGGSKQEAARFIYPNGSSMTVGGLDYISKVMSTDYDLIYVQECHEISLSDHEMLTSRLRNFVLPFQQMIEDVNPQEPWHWILKRVAEGKLTMLVSVHQDNPTLWDIEKNDWTERGAIYMRRLDNLTGVRYQRLRLGKWVAAEGVVYDMFEPDVHLIKGFKIPDEWTRLRSIDFGFVNPFVCLWLALDPDGRVYVYREWYRTGMIVADHAERIKQLSGKRRFEVTVSDHDSEDRATLHANGIFTQRARKAILPGIEAVQKRMRIQQADGRPRLFIMKDAIVNREVDLGERGMPTCLAEELNSYSWAQPVEGKLSKEMPLDLNNHACDALRYAIMYLDHRVVLAAPGGPTQYKSKWVGKHDMTGRREE